MKPSIALQQHREEVRNIALKHRVKNVRFFGSALHGDDTDNSDLDLLVDPTPETTLMDIGAIRYELGKLLGISVDVLTPKAIPLSFRDKVIEESRQIESKADKLRIKDYLTHIVEAIERINRYIDNMSEEEFDRDEKTQDAVIRNFEVIGEASRNIERYHADFAAGHPEVPWGIAYEMRNILTHGYFTVDIEVVWQTTQDNLPTLAGQIRKLLGCMGEVIDNPSLKTSPFEELPIEVDTHELFDTISHSHLDFVDSPDGWVDKWRGHESF